MDADAALDQLARSLEEHHLHGRLRAVDDFVSWLRLPHETDVAQAMSKPQTAYLVRLLLLAMCSPQYTERSWTKALTVAVAEATQSGRCPMFAQVCANQLTARASGAADGQAQLTLLRIIRTIMESAATTSVGDRKPEWARKLIAVQAALQEKMSLDSRSKGDLLRADVILQGLLNARPDYLDMYLEALTEGSTCRNTGVLPGVTTHAAVLPGYHEDIKPRLLAMYIRDTLAIKGGCSDRHMLLRFNPVLESLTPEDFTDVVRPVLEKLLKKNPDSVLVAVTCLVQHVRLDLSSHVGMFLPPLVRQLRSTNDEVRALALDLTKGLSERCSNTEALDTIVSQLLDVLAGRCGIMAQWYQRHTVCMAVESVRCAVASTQAAQPLAARVVDGLLSSVEKESHDNTRAVGLLCATRWSLMLETVPSRFLDLLKTGLGSAARPTAIMYAAAGCQLSKHERFRPQLAPLASKMLERIDMGAKKPNAFSPDAIFCADAVLEVAVSDAATGEELANRFPWQALTSEVSFLFPASAIAPKFAEAAQGSQSAGPLAPHVSEIVCDAVALVAKHVATLEEAHRSVPVVADAAAYAVMQCAVHAAPEVRQAALRAARDVCDVDGAARAPLLRALTQVVHMTAETRQTASAMTTLPSMTKEEGLPSTPPPNRFAAALCGIMGGAALASTTPEVLLLSHNPVVCHSEKGALALWTSIARRNFGGTGALNESLQDEDLAREVSNALLEATSHRLSDVRLSARWALPSLGSPVCGAQGALLVTERIIPALLAVLKEDELRSLTLTEVDIFFTPSNVIYAPPSDGGQPAAVPSKNAKRRGKDAEEAEWEERIRAELGSKSKNGQGPADRSSAAAAARVLAGEDAIRSRVREIRFAAESSLAALRSAFRSCPTLGFASIPGVLDVVMSLVGWKLLDSQVQECLEALAATVPHGFGGRSPLVASALRFVQLKPDAAGRSSVVNECLQIIADTCTAGGPLEQQALTLVFPIVRAVLSNPPSVAQCASALKVVSIHTSMEDGAQQNNDALRELRKSMIEGVLDVVAAFPQMEPSPSVVLASICTAPPLTTGEWSPLLGGRGMLSESSHVRLACLESIMMMVLDGQALADNPLVESRLWLSTFDADEENADLAREVWNERGRPLSAGFAAPLMLLLSDDHAHVREATARALAGGILQHPAAGATLLTRLYTLYSTKVPPVTPKQNGAKLDMDKFFAAPVGAENKVQTKEDAGWPSRAGVAASLKAIGEVRAFDGEGSVYDAFSFLVKEGLADQNTRVRGQMLAAGVAIISAYGEDGVLRFLRDCEAVMADRASKSEDARRFDWRREGVVVFMGCAAKNLDKDNPKVVSIVRTLVGALSTPSEAVQIAVSDCLAPLMKTPVVKEQGTDILKDLLTRCVKGKSYGERRGAAFGVAAVVKGLGIATIKKHQVISTLEAACKGPSFQGKQGALCAFECMCLRLGLLFEPYVIVILPHLLKCFGDSSNHVREAAHDCARAIMSKLSAHGVKLILPAILKSLSDSAWRTKQGAIELLGSMAYCAPRQLADSLPMIVPKLTEAFADTHPKVRDSGRKALEDIGSVIRNPEVASLSMTLMSALSDPSKFTRGALDALLACEFMHSIDAPSLALLVPVLQRGLKDRSADVKRKAALITGNTCSMISEAKDLLPYLSAILPGVKSTCVDPIPDVRATAAKALAALVRGMGEDKVGDVVPWLIETLKADSSSSERSGGAQALSEVLVVLGVTRASSVLGDLLPLAAHPKGSVREGVLWVLCFLPGAMGRDFAPIIPRALPVVLAGLSDEVEAVREVALRSGQVLVSTHGKTHADQLLPALEDGLFDDNWRIRQSSVQLLGDLLYLIGDTKEVALDEGAAEDDARGSTRAGEAIEEALGLDRRNSILASLYLIRSDTSAVVRQSALQVWKTVVPNTPRALREILPILIGQIVAALASGHPDKRTVAGRALGDIVKKLGDQVLPEVVPFLREGLEAGDENMRQGVCLGLAEVMECATPRQIEEFLDTLVPAIQDALCDPSSDVREQSAQAFHSLYKAVGNRSIEHVVPSLLRELAQEGDSTQASSARERAVFGLKEVLQLRPRDLLPYLIPKLVATPISTAHARAIGAVAEVTGGTIHSHLATIIPALVEELARVSRAASEADDARAKEKLKALQQGAATLVSSVKTVGVNWLCNEMARQMSSKDASVRRWSTWLVEQFLRGSSSDFGGRVPQILKELLQRLVDVDQDVLVAVCSSLKALNSRVPPSELVEHLTFARSVIASIVSDARHRRGSGSTGTEFFLPGLNIPKGLEPLLPVYQQGLMYGSAEVREAAASGLGELVEVTSPKYLQPFLIKITGPLIRIVGDRFPPGVKAAILHTLGLLLRKGGASLKPFVPQLQTTFVKALNDSSRFVRKEGRAALGQLTGLTTRVDPLIADLISASSSAGDAAIKTTLVEALAEVLSSAGAKASIGVIEQAIVALNLLPDEADEGVRAVVVEALGQARELRDMKALHLALERAAK